MLLFFIFQRESNLSIRDARVNREVHLRAVPLTCLKKTLHGGAPTNAIGLVVQNIRVALWNTSRID